MHFIDALAIVRDLAHGNMLEIKSCPELSVELTDEIKRHEDAVDKVDQFLDLLRDH